MSYTPPSNDNVVLSGSGEYSPPSNDSVNLSPLTQTVSDSETDTDAASTPDVAETITGADAYAPVLDDSDFDVVDLSCKSDNPPSEPEVLVDVWNGPGEFVRIPVTQVEMWVNKDGPADINRSAKVKFPGEWDGIDIQQFVQGFATRELSIPDLREALVDDGNASEDGVDAFLARFEDAVTVTTSEAVSELNKTDTIDVSDATIDDIKAVSSYDMARVWLYDETNENYQVVQFGYVGGVGPASNQGEFKFWVYDPADLLKAIPVSQSFGEPTTAQVVQFALRGRDESDDPVGLENRTVFEQVAPIQSYIAGLQTAPLQKSEMEDIGREIDRDGVSLSVGPYSIDLTKYIDDIFDFGIGSVLTNVLVGGQKSFKRNRHSMVDVLNWFTDKVGGKWHFEPTPDGPTLWYDNQSEDADNDEQLVRRNFVEKELTTDEGPQLEEEGDTDIPVFDTITTLDNQALRDMKPFNTLRLYGESSRPTRYSAIIEGFSDAAASSAIGESFPFVEVTYSPLLDRAGGHRMMKEVESDAKHLDNASEEAVKQFKKQVEEETEGEMKIVGEPYILPYDYVLNIPVCERLFTNIDASQMRYEVNGVKHEVSAGERYTTQVGVSIALRNEQINVSAEYKPA